MRKGASEAPRPSPFNGSVIQSFRIADSALLPHSAFRIPN
jgi:hypothetical protein